MPWVVAFDTSVLLSAVGWRGNPYRCVELARAGMIEGVTCQEILEELTEKLQNKLGFGEDQATDTVADLLSFLRLVTISNTLKVIAADPDDDKVIECAVAANATHIVSGDRRHLLALGDYGAISIVSAAQLLALVSPP